LSKIKYKIATSNEPAIMLKNGFALKGTIELTIKTKPTIKRIFRVIKSKG